jgi:hypothetical protein
MKKVNATVNSGKFFDELFFYVVDNAIFCLIPTSKTPIYEVATSMGGSNSVKPPFSINLLALVKQFLVL